MAGYKPQTGRYGREFGLAMAGYGLAVALVSLTLGEGWLGATEWPGALKVALLLVPTIPVAFAFWAFLRLYRSLDEFYQRVEAEAALLATAIVLGLSFALGWFEIYGYVPDVPWLIWILPAWIGCYGLVKLGLWLRRRG
ncbi:MAG: hypothetical protein ACFB2Z_02275 [Maricaulaceae bacterium]